MHAAVTRSLVLRARTAGLDPDRILRLTGVPPRSQRRIVHEETMSTLGKPGCRQRPARLCGDQLGRSDGPPHARP